MAREERLKQPAVCLHDIFRFSVAASTVVFSEEKKLKFMEQLMGQKKSRNHLLASVSRLTC